MGLVATLGVTRRPTRFPGRAPTGPNRIRYALLILSAVLPWPVKRRVLALLGYAIDPTARIGISFISAEHVEIGANAYIGHGNVVRNVRSLVLEHDARIRHLNTLTGATWEGWPCSVRFEAGAHMTNSHYLDVGGRYIQGPASIVGGKETQVWTHEVRREGVTSLRWSEVRVGADAYVAARCILLPGSEVPAGGTLAAGSVLPRSVRAEPGSLLGGNPARVLGAQPSGGQGANL